MTMVDRSMATPPVPRVLFAVPGAAVNAGLVDTAGRAGVGLLLDFFAPAAGAVAAALATLPGPVGVRLFHAAPAVVGEVLAHRSRVARLWLEAGWYGTDTWGVLSGAQVPLGLVVGSRGDLEAASEHPEVPIIGRGHDAGGFAGPCSSLVVLQLLAADLGAPFWLEGGLDLTGAAAAVAVGAHGVVLGAAGWAFPEIGGRLAEVAGVARGVEAVRWANAEGQGFRGVVRPAPTDPGVLRRSIAGAPVADWPRRLPADLVPAGQDVEFARANRERFQTLAAFLAEARTRVERAVSERATTLAGWPAAGAPMARLLGCRYPIVQGPMARISDQPGFVAAVAAAGALPVVAFGSLDARRCRNVWNETRRLGVRAGVGIIGLDLQADLVTRQLETLAGGMPPFLWVAAPRPEKCADWVRQGHTVVAHAPARPLLTALYEAGCRWFIAEGAESGGHIGRLSSMVLWQSLLAEIAARGWATDSEAAALAFKFAGELVDADEIERRLHERAS